MTQIFSIKSAAMLCVATLAMCLATPEANAQCPYGGRGFSPGFGGSAISIGFSTGNRGFGYNSFGNSFYRPSFAAPIYRPVGVYGGGLYGGGFYGRPAGISINYVSRSRGHYHHGNRGYGYRW